MNMGNPSNEFFVYAVRPFDEPWNADVWGYPIIAGRSAPRQVASCDRPGETTVVGRLRLRGQPGYEIWSDTSVPPGELPDGLTDTEPFDEASRRLLLRLGLGRMDDDGRFAPDFVALRAYMRAVCGVRDTDLHSLTWGTIMDLLQERERRTQGREIAHSDDFRSVRWFGREYSFTPQQAEIMKLLWEAYEAQTPDVDAALLLSDFSGSAAHRLRDVFRKSPAWGTMIVRGGSRGTYRLSRPT